METVALGPIPESARRDLVAGVEIGIAVEKSAMGAEERGRLEKELDKLTGEIARAGERLSNPDFLGKAPAHVVEGGRAKLAEMRERQAALRSSLGAGVGRRSWRTTTATSRSCWSGTGRGAAPRTS